MSEIRLVAVVSLLLIPILLLGWLFANQSNKDIQFARQELIGTQYLRAIVPLLEKITDNDEITRADLDNYASKRAAYDDVLGVAAEAGRFERSLTLTALGRQHSQELARRLISKIGDSSNLILDPDLDTYYLMDAVVLRIPELISISAKISELETSKLEVIDAKEALRLKGQYLVQLETALDGLRASMDHSLGSTSNSLDLASLKKSYDAYLANVSGYQWRVSAPEKLNAQSQSSSLEVARGQLMFAEDTVAFWTKAVDALDGLLNKRIEELITWLRFGIGVSAALTLLAVFFAFRVLSRLLHRLDDKIVYLAHHDSMTRLKNRGAFTEEMTENLTQALGAGEKIALHLIDIDYFKNVNDTLGHQTGDEVLKSLAERLIKSSRPTDIVGRLGGDEFVVLQRGVESEANATIFANRLVKAMHEPVMIGDQLIRSTISVGTALAPTHAGTPESLMAYADMALYAAKAAGRNQTSLFTTDLECEVQERRRIEQEVRLAVAQNRFNLNYQAQYDTSGSEIRGFEALLRLRGTTGDLIPPAIFIPIAEQLGLIQQIGTWVINRACTVAAEWPRHISLAVNLSPLQFNEVGISVIIEQALRQSGLEPKRLQVEITEGLLMEETEAVLAELAAIRALGVLIVMDDFGTGYSSLGYLWRFPFDKIKIDRSFVNALEGNDVGAQNILRTIVMLGHSLNMKVSAEGVETEAQAAFIDGLKCDEIQGFLFSEPAPEEDLAGIILNSYQKVNRLNSVADYLEEIPMVKAS